MRNRITMTKRLKALVSPQWRVVARMGRVVSGDRIFDICRGVVRVPRIDAPYTIILQEDRIGRRRMRIELRDRRINRGHARRDPIMAQIRTWVRGGRLPTTC